MMPFSIPVHASVEAQVSYDSKPRFGTLAREKITRTRNENDPLR
jgi:hypothetical protein